MYICIKFQYNATDKIQHVLKKRSKIYNIYNDKIQDPRSNTKDPVEEYK